MVFRRKDPGPDWSRVGFSHRALFPWLPDLLNSVYDARVRGLQHVPKQGGAVLASTHSAAWDPVMIASALHRPVFYIAKQEVFRSPFNAWFLKGVGSIPVDRKNGGALALRAAEDAVKAGCIAGVFVEGTRNDGTRLLKPKTGAARLALATGAPVLPVGAVGAAWQPRGKSLPKLKETMYLNFGPPLRYTGDVNDEAQVLKVTEDLMTHLARLWEEARAAHAAGEKWERSR